MGLNFSYANILYLNLPEEESTACISFNTIGCNVFAFLGMITGTLLCSVLGDAPSPFFGMSIYAVQYTTLMRAVGLTAIGLPLVLGWKKLTPDNEIAMIRHMNKK